MGDTGLFVSNDSSSFGIMEEFKGLLDCSRFIQTYIFTVIETSRFRSGSASSTWSTATIRDIWRFTKWGVTAWWENCWMLIIFMVNWRKQVLNGAIYDLIVCPVGSSLYHWLWYSAGIRTWQINCFGSLWNCIRVCVPIDGVERFAASRLIST